MVFRLSNLNRRVLLQTLLALVSACLLVAGLCSCGREEKRLTGNDARGRWMRKADEAAQKGEWDAAVALYERALRHRPDMAAGHRRIAPIFDEQKKDPVAALYHYNRYLELAPNAPDREAVAEAVEHCQQYIAAGTGGDTSALRWRIDSQAETIQQLTSDLAAVRETLRLTQAQLDSALAANAAAAHQTASGAAATPGPRLPVMGRQQTATTPPKPVAKAKSAGATETPGVYVVQSGDTLSRLATRFHTTTETLYAMNRHQMTSPNALRIGMKLVIPVSTP